MKKMFFGATILLVGTLITLTLFSLSVISPIDYNGTSGLHAFLNGTGSAFYFILAVIASIYGLIVCFIESRKN
ncbi:hypothetical protein K5V21_01045 [Clostridium sardiniense]|uniref:Uncharacterized protein n=1 Tax=Clostridium sardiniense TaxID=29369 RepID=A0ABS7KTA1_CLOSR|nr:hypothetical protein [Clostridium sardiniense]MBY0754031.1 hypothetical protein [Clostridium sardiniense]MDQ0459452.1 hypothetical protein [Clostridium sardiniense]